MLHLEYFLLHVSFFYPFKFKCLNFAVSNFVKKYKKCYAFQAFISVLDHRCMNIWVNIFIIKFYNFYATNMFHTLFLVCYCIIIITYYWFKLERWIHKNDGIYRCHVLNAFLWRKVGYIVLQVSVRRQLCLLSKTWEHIGREIWNLEYRFCMMCIWTVLLICSKGQRSDTAGPTSRKLFAINNTRRIASRTFEPYWMVGHDK